MSNDRSELAYDPLNTPAKPGIDSGELEELPDVVRFAFRFMERMGVIDSPGGMEWRNRVACHGGPGRYEAKVVRAAADVLDDEGLSYRTSETRYALGDTACWRDYADAVDPDYHEDWRSRGPDGEPFEANEIDPESRGVSP